MSSPLSVKRRKIDNATSTLKKPFVSPLRSANNSHTPLKENGNTANRAYTPSRLAHTVKAASGPPVTPAATRLVGAPAQKSTPSREQPVFTTSSSRTDPAERAAQKAITSLELQIKNVRNDLDTLAQATRISNSNTDDELQELTEKWRAASQQASEELFGHVKERVCRMGGVAAWRESEQQKHYRAYGLGDFAPEAEESDYADCEFDSQGEELPEEEQEFRKAEKKRVKREAMEAADLPSAEEMSRLEGGDGGKKLVWQEAANDDDVGLVLPPERMLGLR